MIDVKPVGKDALDRLGALMWDAIHNGPSAYTAAQRQAWLPEVPKGAPWAARVGDQQIWLAQQDGMALGFVTLADGGYVDFAYVHSAAQGRGVFRHLMTALETAARTQGTARLWTHASLMAQPAFARLGFRVIRHEDVARDGQTLSRAEMEKALT
ncbi:GNAT family N-acetyltransferase [Tateyamaria sp. SN6-1]|uniref:GNAT family N-acetyltransferase n=1 Tax=Tateyamaria sp. SN6-1 TaxID=3092148 RepID=UPI0039F4A062